MMCYVRFYKKEPSAGAESHRGQEMDIFPSNYLSYHFPLRILLSYAHLIYTQTRTMAPFTLNLGIISTGGISTTFAHDLVVDPACHNIKNVNHPRSPLSAPAPSIPLNRSLTSSMKAARGNHGLGE